MSGTSRSPPLPIWWRTSSQPNVTPNFANASIQQRACRSLESTSVPSMSKMAARRGTGGGGARTLPDAERFERGDQRGHVLGRRRPDLFDIDIVVPVNDPVAHVADLCPRHLWMRRPPGL